MFKNKILIGAIIVLVLTGGFFLLYENRRLEVAHSTFENYYAFRGCVELMDRTDTYGDCRLADGTTIKLVLMHGKWYLDGDGPGVW